jgi:hypothetical protein
MDANLISWHSVVVSQLKLKLFEIAGVNQLLTRLKFDQMKVRKSEWPSPRFQSFFTNPSTNHSSQFLRIRHKCCDNGIVHLNGSEYLWTQWSQSTLHCFQLTFLLIFASFQSIVNCCSGNKLWFGAPNEWSFWVIEVEVQWETLHSPFARLYALLSALSALLLQIWLYFNGTNM